MTMTPPAGFDPLSTFVLGFSTLLSIVNPFASALIFNQVASEYTPRTRALLAAKVAFYSAVVLLTSMWLGGRILSALGLSLSSLRIVGGSLVIASAWKLLRGPENSFEERAASADCSLKTSTEVAFFPLTMPLTCGAGSMATSIALASQQPMDGTAPTLFFLSLSGAAVAIAISVWLLYAFSHRIVNGLGAAGSKTVTRLASFVLLCVGVQVLTTGLTSLIPTAARCPG